MSERFLIITTKLIPENECWLLIKDYIWFAQHQTDIKTWVTECLENFEQEGMFCKFRSIEDRNLFLMRYSCG